MAKSSVLLDFLEFLSNLEIDGKKYFPSGTIFELGSVSTADPTVAVIPTAGSKIETRFACGGFIASQEFAIYYRAAITSPKDNSNAIELLESLGTMLTNDALVPGLTAPRTVESLEQIATTTKQAEAGSTCDYAAQFRLVYTDD